MDCLSLYKERKVHDSSTAPPSIAEWNWSGDEKGAEDKFCINLSSRLKDYNNTHIKKKVAYVGSSINEKSHV